MKALETHWSAYLHYQVHSRLLLLRKKGEYCDNSLQADIV